MMYHEFWYFLINCWAHINRWKLKLSLMKYQKQENIFLWNIEEKRERERKEAPVQILLTTPKCGQAEGPRHVDLVTFSCFRPRFRDIERRYVAERSCHFNDANHSKCRIRIAIPIVTYLTSERRSNPLFQPVVRIEIEMEIEIEISCKNPIRISYPYGGRSIRGAYL